LTRTFCSRYVVLLSNQYILRHSRRVHERFINWRLLSQIWYVKQTSVIIKNQIAANSEKLLVSLSFNSVTFPSFILLYRNLITPYLEGTLEYLPADGLMSTSTGYDTPGDGCIYHPTGYLNNNWTAHWTRMLPHWQNVANHVSVHVKCDQCCGDPYK